MTSMPASRSARAMILAPRSCPSRPGLATTTRILRRDSGLSAAVSVVACISREGTSAQRAARGRRPERSGAEFYRQSALNRLARHQLTVGEPLAQHLLVELADARLGNRVDESEIVRNPPLCDFSC